MTFKTKTSKGATVKSKTEFDASFKTSVPPGGVTVDSTVITVDSTLITADQTI